MHQQTFYATRNPFIHSAITQAQILVASTKIYRLRLASEIALYFHQTASAAPCLKWKKKSALISLEPIYETNLSPWTFFSLSFKCQPLASKPWTLLPLNFFLFKSQTKYCLRPWLCRTGMSPRIESSPAGQEPQASRLLARGGCMHCPPCRSAGSPTAPGSAQLLYVPQAGGGWKEL